MAIKPHDLTTESGTGITLKHTIYHDTARPDPRRRLMLLLPGMGYTCDMPLLRYLFYIGLQSGYHVLPAPYFFHFTGQRFDMSQMNIVWSDAQAVLEVALAQGFDELLIAGKSFGTPIAAGTAQAMQIPMSLILLTPIGDSVVMAQGIQTLVQIGTADSAYDADKVQDADSITWKVYDGLDHSLEVPGDWRASLAALGRVMDDCAAFIDGQDGAQ